MTADNLGWAFLFLVIVGVMVAGGIVIGMIAAGRIDKHMTPGPKARPDDPPPGAVPAPPTSSQEDQP